MSAVLYFFFILIATVYLTRKMAVEQRFKRDPLLLILAMMGIIAVLSIPMLFIVDGR